MTCGWHSMKSCQLHVSAGILCVLPWLISVSPARWQIVIAGLHTLAALETWSTGQTGPPAKSSRQQPDFTSFFNPISACMDWSQKIGFLRSTRGICKQCHGFQLAFREVGTCHVRPWAFPYSNLGSATSGVMCCTADLSENLNRYQERH